MKKLTTILRRTWMTWFVNSAYMEEGMDPVEEKEESSSDRLKWGILILSAGVVFSVAGYFLAPAGGRYYVFWGAIVVGALYILFGRPSTR